MGIVKPGSTPDERDAPATMTGTDDDLPVTPLAVVAAGVARWATERHARVDSFVDANFRFTSTIRLHRRALSADLLRAPANVAVMPLFVVAQLAASALRTLRLRRAAAWLGSWQPFLETAVARELTWRLNVDLLELPYDDGRRRSEHDALAAAILAEANACGWKPSPGSGETLLPHLTDARLAARLGRVIATWTGTRAAASELINNLTLAGAGASAFQQLTPGALSLAPLVAGVLAQQAAIVSFPLGATLGSLWYGVFVVSPSPWLVAGVTVALMALGAALTAFAGIIGDPVMRATGLHRRRLHRLIDALAGQLGGDSRAALTVRDHYVARIFDLVDVVGAAARGMR